MPFELHWINEDNPTAYTIEVFIDLLYKALSRSINSHEDRKGNIRFLCNIMRASAAITTEIMANCDDELQRIEIKPALSLSILAAGAMAKLSEIDIGPEIQREYPVLEAILLAKR